MKVGAARTSRFSLTRAPDRKSPSLGSGDSRELPTIAGYAAPRFVRVTTTCALGCPQPRTPTSCAA
jgi:hypothetical protein